MNFPKGLGARLLAIVPAIMLVALCNVFIAFATAGVVLLQLLDSGVNKHIALAVALLIAIGVHAYVAWNHKIRDFIKVRSKHE